MPLPTTTRRTFLSALAAGAALTFLKGTPAMATGSAYAITKSDAEWRQQLSAAQYNVLRAHGTEPPGSSPLNDEKRAGLYLCAACAQPLFDAKTKYNSGTGWPSFWDHLPQAIGTTTDHKLIVPRTEVHCARCGGHLGHVFEDGPKPTGLRYCMNGVALTFEAAKI